MAVKAVLLAVPFNAVPLKVVPLMLPFIEAVLLKAMRFALGLQASWASAGPEPWARTPEPIIGTVWIALPFRLIRVANMQSVMMAALFFSRLQAPIFEEKRKDGTEPNQKTNANHQLGSH